DARTRIWLVLDGDILYVDRNGNGDLTEDSERFTCQRTPGDAIATYPFEEIRRFAIGGEIVANGTTWTRLEVTHTTIKNEFTPGNRSDRELQACYAKDPTLTRAGITIYLNDKVRVTAVSQWGDRPDTAPICHIGGALSMACFNLQELQRGNKPSELQFCIGFAGLGKGSEDAFGILDYY